MTHASTRETAPSGRGATAWLRRGRRAVDRLRVREHLRRVERDLRRADVDHLDPERRRRREAVLDDLRAYRRRGAVPINDEAPERTPCFVGAEGTPCAVAALLLADGRDDLVAEVAETDNALRIEDCEDERLLDWLDGVGLTRDEAARIQPAYDAGVFLATDCGSMACSTVGLLAGLIGTAAFAVLEAVGYRIASGAFPGNALKRRATLGYVTVLSLLLAPLLAALSYALFP